MATQTDVQQLIQGLTPTAVNNGNPNTAYNNSARTVINPNDYVARISGAPIPQMDAQGNWLMGQISQSPTVDFSPRDLTALLPRTQINMPVMPRLPMLGGGGGGGGTAPVVTPPTTQPPVVSPPVDTGGNTPPSTGGGGNTGSVSLGGGGGNTTLPGNNLNNLPPLGSFQGGLNTGGNGAVTELPDWQQILDMAGDAFGLPGNWYLQNTGQWDISNILQGLGDYATGGLASLGLDALTQLYTDSKSGMFRDSAPQWLQDHLRDNVQNEATGLLNQWNEATDKRTNELISKQTESILNKYGMTNTPAFSNATQAIRGGMPAAEAARIFGAQAVQAAISQNPYSVDVGTRLAAGVGKGGAGVISGDAARDMFAAMKLGQMGAKQSGGDIYGRTYER